MNLKSASVSFRLLTAGALMSLAPSLSADALSTWFWTDGLLSDKTGPDTYSNVPFFESELASIWAGSRAADNVPVVLTLPRNTFAHPTAAERIGGGQVSKNLGFHVTKYSNFGTPIPFVLEFSDFDQIGWVRAFLPELAGPLTMRMRTPSDGSVTRVDFKVRAMNTASSPKAEYVELSCSLRENEGRSSELVLGEGDIAYRRHLGTIGIKAGRVAKVADTDFVIKSYHLGRAGVYPDYTKRLLFSAIGTEMGSDKEIISRTPFTSLRTDVSDDKKTNGRTSLQAFRGPCVITIEAVDGGAEWAFQQFYVHRGNGSQFVSIGDQDGPRILSQPRNVTAESGDTVTLSVTAHGAQDLTHQWLFDGKPIPGATRSTLTIKNVRAGDEGDYTVKIRSGKDTVTSDSAFVDVKGYAPQPGPRPPR